jgi:membrane protease subunit (stomatin/prohibitin family)
VSSFSDVLGESKIAALDLASNYEELSKFIRSKINDEFKSFGLELTKFVIENISLPAEVEAAMDRRTSMGVIGDAGRYAQFQAADAMRDAAQNPGGGAGTGAGLGAGFAIGNAMAGAMSSSLSQAKPSETKATCPKCGASNSAGVKFCNECGAKMEVVKQTVPCVKCGAELQSGAKFCPECGAKQEKQKCANCQAELPAGAKFCNECGTKVEAAS